MVFLKKVNTGKKTYYYIVESYRDKGVVKHRILRKITPDEISNKDKILEEYRKREIKRNKVDKVIILAAGKSERLVPLGSQIPVTLINIKQKSIIDYIIKVYQSIGVSSIIVVGGFRFLKLKEHLSQYKNVKVIENPFFSSSKSLASLYFAREELDSEVFICYGDVLYSNEVLLELNDVKGDLVIAVSSDESDHESDKVRVNEDNLISIRKETMIDNSIGSFMGVSKLSKNGAIIFRRILEETMRQEDFNTYHFHLLFERLAQTGEKIDLLNSKAPWIDINYPEEITYAAKNILPLFRNL